MSYDRIIGNMNIHSVPAPDANKVSTVYGSTKTKTNDGSNAGGNNNLRETLVNDLAKEFGKDKK